MKKNKTKTQKKVLKYKYHLFLLLFLSFVFFYLIIASVSRVGLNVEYNFKDQISISNPKIMETNFIDNQNVKIGNVTIRNDNFLIPKIVDLNKFILCPEKGQNTFSIRMFYYQNQFGRVNYGNFYGTKVEVKSNSKKEMNIGLSIVGRLNQNNNSKSNLIFNYGLYEMKNNGSGNYDYYLSRNEICNAKSNLKFIKKIKLVINIK